MKKKLSKILGVGLTLALLTSLLLVASPVSALTQPAVSITAATDEIGQAGKYTISFRISEELLSGTATISVRFPEDTDVPATFSASDITLEGTSGIGSDAFTAVDVSENATGSGQTVIIDLVSETWDGTGGNLPNTKIGVMADLQIVFETAADVLNPTDPGDYTLEVKTFAETTWVESTTYTIEAPVLGGIVSVYNPSGVLMATFSGTSALNDAESDTPDSATDYFAKDNYTIEVGPGTYVLTTGGDGSATIELSGEGLTLVSTDGAAVTIITSSVTGVPLISFEVSDDITYEGFTLKDLGVDQWGIWIKQNAEGATVKNSIFTGKTDSNHAAITLQGEDGGVVVTDATISGNVISGFKFGIVILEGAIDNTISGNTITGSRGATVGAIWLAGGGSTSYKTQSNTISENTITDNAGYGIHISGGSGVYLDDNLIEGNTISGNEKSGIQIETGFTITDLVITGNDITDNEGVGIVVESWTAASNAIKFNNISGNDADNDGYGIETNLGSTVDVDATHNWWGSSVASEVADMVYDTGAGDTDYTPFLSDTVDAVFSATALDTSADSLDAETEVGVKVSTTNFTTNYVISAAKYIDNPGAPLDNPLAFYDVYVTGDIGDDDVVVVKFYADGVDEDSVVYAWNELYDTWQECDPQDFSFWGGYAYVTIHSELDTDDPTTPTIEALTGLPFAIVGEEVFNVMDYDADGDGVISKTEALTAIADYFSGEITKAEALLVIVEYMS